MLCGPVALCQSGEPSLLTNLEILQQLGRQVADSVAKKVGTGDTVRVEVRPAEHAWFLQQGILAAFEGGGKIINQSSGSRYVVELGLLSARIAYIDKRRPGLFDARVVDRVATLDMDARIVDRVTGGILLNQTVSEARRDTIAAGDIERFENPAIPVTHGAPPDEGFFNSILEPFVVVGAVAVAVYLLFHVRS
jgi:hypothetical protein